MLNNGNASRLYTSDSVIYSLTGSSHKMVPLEELAIALIEIINDKKIWVFDKEESLLEVEKSLTSLLSGFDSSTEEMVQTLHHTRDKQVSLFNV